MSLSTGVSKISSLTSGKENLLLQNADLESPAADRRLRTEHSRVRAPLAILLASLLTHKDWQGDRLVSQTENYICQRITVAVLQFLHSSQFLALSCSQTLGEALSVTPALLHHLTL